MEKNVQILKARGRQTMWKIFIEYDDKSKLTIMHEKGSLVEKRWKQWQKVNQSVSHSG